MVGRVTGQLAYVDAAAWEVGRLGQEARSRGSQWGFARVLFSVKDVVLC